MRLGSQRQTVLLRHGFTEAQARVYLALLDQPAMSAGDLSKVTTVPRSHLYKVLGDLHARGLVDILAAPGTREYRARAFSDFLRARSVELRERLTEIDGDIDTVGAVMRPPDLEVLPEHGEDAARVVVGRRAVAREIDDLLEGAGRSIVISCTEGSPGRLARHAAAHAAAWRSKGIVASVVLQPSRSSAIEWERLVAEGAIELRWLQRAHNAFAVCVDGARMIVVRPHPDNGELRVGKDFGVFIADPAIVEAHVGLLVDASSQRPPE